MKILFIITCCTLALFSYAKVNVTVNGKSVSQIIINKNSDVTIKFAAEELAKHIKLISGEAPDIRHEILQGKTAFILGNNEYVKQNFSDDISKLQATDGYAVRQVGQKVYLFATCSKGILNGVYKLLRYNTDIIWARPDEKIGTIFSKNNNLTFNKVNYIDIPVFKLRGYQMIGPRQHNRTSELWQVRQASNWNAVFNLKDSENNKYAMYKEFGGGHNLTRLYITEEKYYKNHPEYFPLIKGKRVRPGSRTMKTQLCFTNVNMTSDFIKELDIKLAKNPNYNTIRIMIEDNWDQCECSSCRAPIKLSNGTILTDKEKNYYSTRFFIWLNSIASYMQKKYPGKRILTHGYYFTEFVPAVKVSPIIDIAFCPIFKDSKYPINSFQNKKTYDKVMSFLKNTPNLTWREYYGLTGPFPRPVDAIAIADWKYISKYGVSRTYSEMNSDDIKGPRQNGVLVWDVNAPYYWVLANGSWNPNVSVEELRNEFFTRVYGSAANEIKEFYSIIEENWLKAPGGSFWNDSVFNSYNMTIFSKGLTNRCKQLLALAAKKKLHPNAKIMLNRLTQVFDSYAKATLKMKLTALRAKTVVPFDPEFKEGPWADAESITNFTMNGIDLPAKSHTAVKLLYDDKNLYFGVKLYHKNPAKMEFRPPTPGNVQPLGEGVEIFISGFWKGQKGYVQLVTDPAGNRQWSFKANRGWKGKWSNQVKLTSEGWSALVSISFEELGVMLGKDKISATVIHQYNRPSAPMIAPGKADHIYLTSRHKADTFYEIEFK